MAVPKAGEPGIDRRAARTLGTLRRSLAELAAVGAVVLASTSSCAATAPRPAPPAPTSAPAASRAVGLEAELDAAVARAMATGSPGMIVAVGRGEQVLFARGYGLANLEDQVPVTVDTVFAIASITKQFTAAAVLLLVEEGKVGLEDRLSRFVPEVPQAARVTVRQALEQTSGISDYAQDPEGDRYKSVRKTPAEMARWISELRPAFGFEPGTSWAYSNSNYALLGLVVERASGESLQAFFARRLFGPAGMTHTAFDDPADVVPRRARGYRAIKGRPGEFRNADWISPTVPGPAGGLRSTVGDLLRWSAALFGGRVLSAGSLQRMTTPGRLADGRTTRAAMPAAMQAAWGSDYAMGVLVGSPDGRARVWHAGDIDGFSSWAAYYPAEQLSVVILQNSQSADRNEAEIEQIVLRSLRPTEQGANAAPHVVHAPR